MGRLLRLGGFFARRVIFEKGEGGGEGSGESGVEMNR